MKSLTLTVLDIGSRCLRAVCGAKDLKTNEIKIMAKIEVPCFGARSGEIVKPEQIALALQEAIAILEKQTNWKIREAMSVIGGSHIFAMASQGLVSVARADQRISFDDVQRVLKAAQAVNLPLNKEVLEIFPQEFIVDGQGGIKDPIGLAGMRLEVKSILACLFSPVLENLEKAVEKAGLRLIDVMVAPLACARAVLNQEQKELGTMLIEIGGGATSAVVFEKGVLRDFVIFPVGSANITNDIAIGMRTEIPTAEKIKIDYGFLPTDKKSSSQRGKAKEVNKADSKNQKASLDPINLGVEFSQKFLDKIVQARINEIFSEIHKAMKKYIVNQSLPSGIVLAGGGAKLPGLVEYAKEKFKLPCRLGRTQGLADIDDLQWASCFGLLLSAFEDEEKEMPGSQFLPAGNIKEKIKRVIKSFMP